MGIEGQLPAAVVVTGAYGTGKTSIVEEMADILEKAGRSYAAIDLDWLVWFEVPHMDEALSDRVRRQPRRCRLQLPVGRSGAVPRGGGY